MFLFLLFRRWFSLFLNSCKWNHAVCALVWGCFHLHNVFPRCHILQICNTKRYLHLGQVPFSEIILLSNVRSNFFRYCVFFLMSHLLSQKGCDVYIWFGHFLIGSPPASHLHILKTRLLLLVCKHRPPAWLLPPWPFNQALLLLTWVLTRYLFICVCYLEKFRWKKMHSVYFWKIS